MSENATFPGEKIASIEQYEAGHNTFDDGDMVRAATIGQKDIDKTTRIASIKHPKMLSIPKDGDTIIGDDVLIMTGVHVAHDCKVGNNVILVNLVALGGHVEVDDWAILGGASTVHQFCKIGRHVMLAANSKIVQDVPPFILAGKYPVKYTGINSLGLKRRNFSNKQRMTIKKAYRYYFRSDLNTSVSLKKIKDEFKKDKNIKEIVSFIENSQRGII